MSSQEVATIEEERALRRGRIMSDIAAVIFTIIELVLGLVYASVASSLKLPSIYAILALGYTVSSIVALISWIYSLKFSPRALVGKSEREIVSFLTNVFQALYEFHRSTKWTIVFGIALLVILPIATAYLYTAYPGVYSAILAFVIIGFMLALIGIFVVYRHVLPVFTAVQKLYEIIQLSIAIVTLEVAIIDKVVPIITIGTIMVIVSAISLAIAVLRHRVLIHSVVPTF